MIAIWHVEATSALVASSAWPDVSMPAAQVRAAWQSAKRTFLRCGSGATRRSHRFRGAAQVQTRLNIVCAAAAQVRALLGVRCAAAAQVRARCDCTAWPPPCVLALVLRTLVSEKTLFFHTLIEIKK